MEPIELILRRPAGSGEPPVSLVFGESQGPQAVTLVFRDASPPQGLPVALVFGDGGVEPEPQPEDVTLSAAGQITGFRGVITLASGQRLDAGGRITGFRGTVAAAYFVNAQRPLAGHTLSGFGQADRVRGASTDSAQDAGRVRAAHTERVAEALHLASPSRPSARQAAEHAHLGTSRDGASGSTTNSLGSLLTACWVISATRAGQRHAMDEANTKSRQSDFI